MHAVSFGARNRATCPQVQVPGAGNACCFLPANLGLKDKSFQAVGSFLSFLLFQVSEGQVLKSVG